MRSCTRSRDASAAARCSASWTKIAERQLRADVGALAVKLGRVVLGPEDREQLRPRLVVPMHYRPDAVDFLEPPDAFLYALGARVERLGENEFEAERFLGSADQPTVALLAIPGSR